MRNKKLFFLLAVICFLQGANAKEVFTLTSPDLPSGKPIGADLVGSDFGCHGPNQSPALNWTGAPAGTKSFFITMFDTYRPPASGWWHWIVYNLPATTRSLSKNAGTIDGSKLPSGAKQARPDGDNPQPRYYGPCPDVGDKPHHYIITIYALSVDHLDVPPTATAAHVDYLTVGKVLAKASIDRTYAR